MQLPEPIIPPKGDFKWETSLSIPLPKSGILIQYTRYLRGNLITSAFEDIAEIVPYPKMKHGGRIIFKDGAEDHYYMVWPMKIIP